MHTNGNGQGMNTDRFFSSSPSGNQGSPNGSGSSSGDRDWGTNDKSCTGTGCGARMGTGSSHWNTEASSGPIDTTDLSIIQDEMHTEALLYKKCAVYADYFTDPQLKSMARTAAEHHRRHFDRLQGYLNSSK